MHRNTRLILTGLVFLLVALLLAPCGSKKPAEEELFGETVTITREYAGRTVIVRTGGQLLLQLDGNPTTGYDWQFTELDPERLDVLEAKTRQPVKSGRVGSGSLFVWRLRAKAPGRTVIRLAYFRPWEGAGKAAETFEITIDIRP
ncbi:MAG: protease inhibitor I42 family protein [Proteobacteria bacterium]|nr:protease inhibitor I42 family protein [Pseudomonadota bacterium]